MDEQINLGAPLHACETPAPTPDVVTSPTTPASEDEWNTAITQARGEDSQQESIVSAAIADFVVQESVAASPDAASSVAAEAVENVTAPSESKQSVPITAETSEEVVESTKPAEENPGVKAVQNSFDSLFDDSSEQKQETLDPSEIPLDKWLLSIPTGTSEDIRAIRDSYTSPRQFQKDMNDPATFVCNLFSTATEGLTNGASKAISDILKASKGADPNLSISIADANFKAAFTRGKNYGSDGSAKVLVGRQAKLAMEAFIQGLIRVKLPNSGFSLVLRPPRLAELSEFFNSVQLEATEFGRTIGSHFALCYDVFIKQKFMELIERYGLVQDSNLENWQKYGTISKYVSIHDYDVLIWAVLSLMYRKGISVRTVCPKCKRIEEDVVIDINESMFTNNKLYTAEVREWWNTKGAAAKVSVEDVVNYQQNIVNKASTVMQNIDIGKIGIELRVPTMSEFLVSGIEFVNRLNVLLHGDEKERAAQVEDRLILHIYQMFKPWVKSVTTYNDDGSVNFKVEDSDSIESVLEAGRQENEAFSTSLNEYISNTKISYIGTMALECPHCHAKPLNLSDNFYPLDVASIFFALSCR